MNLLIAGLLASVTLMIPGTDAVKGKTFFEGLSQA